MKAVFHTLFLTTALFIVSGCTRVGPDFVSPSPELSDKWKTVEQNSSTEVLNRWWEKLNDSALNALVEKALKQNKEIAIAAAKNESFMAKLGLAKSSFFPQLNAGASASTQQLSNTTANHFSSFNDHTTTYGLNLAMSQYEIDFWGKYARAEESAKAALLASDYAHKLIQSSITANVVSTYNSLLSQHVLLENAYKNRVLAEQIASISQAKWNQGVGSYGDVLQAEASVDESSSKISPIEAKISALENSLSILTGEFPKEFVMSKKYLSLPSIDIPAGIPSTLLKRRPDILAAESSWHASNASIGMAKAAYFPSFSLTGILGFQSAELTKLLESPSSIWQIAPSVTLPIFTAGRIESEVNIAKAQTKEAQLQYEQTLLIAFGEVENALKERHTLLVEGSALESAQKKYIQAEAISKSQYDNGKTAYLPLLVIRQSLIANENQLVLNEEAKRQNFVMLCKALGGGWENETKN
ncbi:MAG: efflux transporter outer membrane subunit [Campylobacterales bacterium]|nr:efflux transporter outer membrane subunit [Campylobacterales bacterium]